MMLTGSDEPSNQLARCLTPPGLCLLDGSCASTSNSFASFTALSGELVRLERSEGRNVENLVGDADAVLVCSGGRSAAVLERWWLREDVGGGIAIAGLSCSSKGVRWCSMLC